MRRAPPAIKDYFDHIYVDLNGYIHTVGRYAPHSRASVLCVYTRLHASTLLRTRLSRFRRAANEEQLFTLLFRELDGLFKVCVARQSIFVAVDGPGTRTHGHCLWCATAA